MARRALITGITGQDGSYLAELLLEKGYEVHGIVRRVALEDTEHRMPTIRHLLGRVQLHASSMESYPSLYKTVQRVRPDECYHLAAQSFVGYSFEDEFATLDTNIHGTHYMLSSIKDLAPACRFYFAASSEMFGRATEVPQSESTPMRPRSAYGISKVAGFHLTQNYREGGLWASAGILYNHESPRRGYEFVTRKISHHAALIKCGLKKELRLGNLDAQRDWGHAKDYVHAMWLMMQQEQPANLVIASGKTHSVRQFAEQAFGCLGLDYTKYVVTDPQFYRPAEAHVLCGDASRARTALGWSSEYSFEMMVKEMVNHDHSLVRASSASAT